MKRRIVFHTESDPPASTQHSWSSVHWFVNGDEWWLYDQERGEWLKHDLIPLRATRKSSRRP